MPADLVLSVVGAAIRACGLGLVSSAGLFVFRIRSSAARHAIWTVVLVGMLLQIPLGLLAPTIPIKAWPTLAPYISAQVTQSSRISTSVVRPLPRASHRRSEQKSKRPWSDVALTGAYLAVSIVLFLRMALGFFWLSGVLRDAEPISSLGSAIFASDLLTAPGSVGCFRRRILFPRCWIEWDAAKLRAVLAHERAHVRRRDWLIRIASQVNVCIFWFHPLAWWIERELARLAEEACDDAALHEIDDREEYAAVLVDIALAAAVHRRGWNWRVIAMADESNVVQRVNRILSRTLELPKPLGALAWMTLLACSLPVIYLSSAVQVASANQDTRAQGHARGRITSIMVHGYRRVPRDFVLSKMSTHAGDIYDQASIERDINSLWNTGLFTSIRIEREVTANGWIIHIYLNERPGSEKIAPHAAGQKSSRDLIAQEVPDSPLALRSPPLTAGEDIPVTMCILIDHSGSMRDQRDSVNAAALGLIKASRRHDKVCIISFNDEVFNELPNGEDFTSDIREMEQALKGIDSRGGTALRDAVLWSLGLFRQKSDDRKAVVLITDGGDSSSRVTQEQLLSSIKESGVRLYCIGLVSQDSPGRAGAARLALGQFAEVSGGMDFFPRGLAEVESTSHEIATEVRKQ